MKQFAKIVINIKVALLVRFASISELKTEKLCINSSSSAIKSQFAISTSSKNYPDGNQASVPLPQQPAIQIT